MVADPEAATAADGRMIIRTRIATRRTAVKASSKKPSV
jgi:hypothetical protein